MNMFIHEYTWQTFTLLRLKRTETGNMKLKVSIPSSHQMLGFQSLFLMLLERCWKRLETGELGWTVLEG